MSLLEAPAAAADPRPSNHGGQNPHPHTLTPPIGAHFDWYQATFDAVDDERIPVALAIALGGAVRRAKGRNGYAQGWEVFSPDQEVLASVYGRSARAGEVHVAITGSASIAAVPVVRRMWPEHRVSRVDSALDFLADFGALDDMALRFAKEHGLSYRLVTDSEGGATRYVGSPASELMVRLYKKSEQLRAKHPDQAALVPDGIVRAECQARPGKRAAKETAATLEPQDIWGLSRWSALFAAQILDLEPLRTVTHFTKSSDYARSLHWLGVQYGPLVQEARADMGRDAVVRDVLEALGLSS